ncbi:hypothetical protein G3580_18240 [Nitrogeniibacter mangrovi]|uniref:Uncharacterized protein n=1 Tax=Nitrogeniibacter mangrovi TaxID=2016596 RepID=A0A6C1BAT5_9RHOO|nr:hypothetical protein [Nitrogeniibacter mangrovi]QID19384.1 hypothetical protein G3580_18240 [Nitrogeniibacter mangrovi]
MAYTRFVLEAVISTSEIPAQVQLIAAVSRLLDLHQSRSGGESVSVPETPESAGRNLFVALSLLDVLRQFELDQGRALVSVRALAREAKELVPDITYEEVLFCVASLSTPREIRYGIRDDDSISYGRTSEATPLLTYDRGLGQVALNDNAGLFLRVSDLKESWLYSDLDAQRLVKAIERGRFEDIPRFCREMVADLAAKARQMVDVTERVTLADLRGALIADGDVISATLSEAVELVNKALQLLFSPAVQDAFDLWKATHPVEFEIGNLQSELEIVLQSTEHMARRFVQFIDDAQRIQTLRAPSLRFLDLVRSLNQQGDDFVDQLRAAAPDLMPWKGSFDFFSPDAFVGEVDLTRMLAQMNAPVAEPVFAEAGEEVQEDEPLHAFVERNRDRIISALRKGPLSFEDLLQLDGMEFSPDGAAASLVGVYSYPEILCADGAEIRVVHEDTLIAHDQGGRVLITSNPIFTIENESQEESHEPI